MTRSPSPRFVHEASEVMDAPWMWRGGEVVRCECEARCEGEVERWSRRSTLSTGRPWHWTPRGLPSGVVERRGRRDHRVSKVDSHLAGLLRKDPFQIGTTFGSGPPPGTRGVGSGAAAPWTRRGRAVDAPWTRRGRGT